MKRLVACTVASMVVGLAHVAHAYPTGAQFDLDALSRDGGGGIAFDGAPRYSGHTCAVCHTGAPQQIHARLEADKVELFGEGWRAGEPYHLRVLLLDHHAAAEFQAAGDTCGFAVQPYTRCDQNGFALEIDDRDGRPTGTFTAVENDACTTDPPGDDNAIRVLADGTAVTHSGVHFGELAWDVCWTAPAAGTGPLTAYLAVVDGDGGDGTMEFPADTVNDDVASSAVPLPEAGGTRPVQVGGCAVTGETGSALGVVVALAYLMRRRRWRWRDLAVLLALVTASGCVHVRPRQRETLARRNMKFAPDPTEDELDLHMQESREGSSGGYGSSGGGCGCN